MISPYGVLRSQGGARSNASAFARPPNGVPDASQGTTDARHVMNWLLSATPGVTETPSQGGSKHAAGGSVKVSLVPNEDGSDAVERGATLKHFLSRKAESLTPKCTGANVPGSGNRPASIPSFTQSELNLLLTALGSTPSTTTTPRGDAPTTGPFKESTESPRRASTRRHTRAS